jgi:hypothetical protein
VIAHPPRVVPKLVIVKLAGGVSIILTDCAPVPADPALLTTIV